jgi:hypothetical protein
MSVYALAVSDGSGMSQHFLCFALVNPVANAERLPGFPEGVEVHHSTEIIRVRDARLLQIRPEALIRGKPAKENRRGRRRMRRPHLAQQSSQIAVQRHGPLVFVLGR